MRVLSHAPPDNVGEFEPPRSTRCAEFAKHIRGNQLHGPGLSPIEMGVGSVGAMARGSPKRNQTI